MVHIIRFSFVALILLIWQAAIDLRWISEPMYGSPKSIAQSLLDWFAEKTIFYHIFTTFSEVILGFIIGILLGTIIAYIFAFSKTISLLFDPLMAFLNAIPRLILAPLFIMWFGIGIFSKIMFVVIIVFFISYFNIYTGLREMSKTIIDNARILGASRRELIRYVYLPSILVWVISSSRVGIGFAIIGAVVGEYMGSRAGLGSLISLAEEWGIISQILAGLVIIMSLAGCADFLLRKVEIKYSKWKIF